MRPNDQNGIEPVAQRAVLHRRGVFFNRGCCGLHWQHHLYWHFTHQVSISNKKVPGTGTGCPNKCWMETLVLLNSSN